MNLDQWKTAESLTVVEAAYLLSGADPAALKGGKKRLFDVEPGQWTHRLEKAIKSKSLPALRVVVKGFGGTSETLALDSESVGPHSVLVPEHTHLAVAALIAWCLETQSPIPWPFLDRLGGKEQPDAPQDPSHVTTYPAELRAAIDAYEAVKADPSSTARVSPKTALLRWLARNRPELSANARERVATVANWQPTGGAPKTLAG